ncbi:MAG: DUF4355 domain-containing protein [Anaerocolumna sp.]
MGFIENIVNAMKPDSSKSEVTPESVTEEKTSSEAEPDVQESETDVEQTEETTDTDEKKYSQQELDQMFEDKKKEWELERIGRLSKDATIEELKAELSRRDLKDKVNATLTEKRLPIGLADLVHYSDESGTMKHLEKVMGTVNQLVEEGIKERLKGKTPAGLGGATYSENSLTDTFAKTFVDAMKN